MKRMLCVLLLVFSSLIFFVSCNSSGGELDDAAPDNQGLTFYLKDDGTYAVSLGSGSKFLSKIILPESYRGKPVVEFTSNPNKGDGVFNVLSLTIPKTIKVIDVHALDQCFKLIEVINHSDADFSFLNGLFVNNWHQILEYHSGESKIKTYNDFNFLTSNGVNYLLGYSGNDEILNLPADYHGEEYVIYDYAFYNNVGIRSIRISKGVSRIGMDIINFHPTMFYLESICYEGSEEEFFKIPGSLYFEGTDLNQFNCALEN